MRQIRFLGQVKNVEFAEAKKATKSLRAKRAKNNNYLFARKNDPSNGFITSRKVTRLSRERTNNSQAFAALDKFKTKEQIQKEIESGERNLGNKLWKKKAQERAKKEADFIAEVKKRSQKVEKEVAEKNLRLKQPSKFLSKRTLGAAGLLTAGAIGYTIYRKTRKDKGKKRGRYAK